MSWFDGFGGAGAGAAGPAGPAGTAVVSETQAPSNGQTVFTLNDPPINAGAIWFIFNRATLVKGTDYGVTGATLQTITLTGTAPAVKDSDEIEIKYQKAS